LLLEPCLQFSVIPTEVEESLIISERFRDVSTPLDMTT